MYVVSLLIEWDFKITEKAPSFHEEAFLMIGQEFQYLINFWELIFPLSKILKM